MTNIVFYTMEMKFILCSELTLNVGEIGPVEVELILTTVLLLGGYIGADSFQTSISELWGIQNEWLKSVQLNYLIGSLFTFL